MRSIAVNQFLSIVRYNCRRGKYRFGEFDGHEKFLVNRKIYDTYQPYFQRHLVVIPKIKKIYVLKQYERQVIFGPNSRTHMTMKDVHDKVSV